MADIQYSKTCTPIMPQHSNFWHYHSHLLKMSKVSSAGIVPLTFSSWGKLKPFCCFTKRPSQGPFFLSQIPCSTLSEDKACDVWLSIGVHRLLFLKRCPDLILLCLIAPFDTTTISSLIHSHTFFKFFSYLMCFFFLYLPLIPCLVTVITLGI